MSWGIYNWDEPIVRINEWVIKAVKITHYLYWNHRGGGGVKPCRINKLNRIHNRTYNLLDPFLQLSVHKTQMLSFLPALTWFTAVTMRFSTVKSSYSPHNPNTVGLFELKVQYFRSLELVNTSLSRLRPQDKRPACVLHLSDLSYQRPFIKNNTYTTLSETASARQAVPATRAVNYKVL